MKNLKINNVEVYVKECGNKSTPEAGIQLMATSPENVYGKEAKYGQPLLEHAICWSKS